MQAIILSGGLGTRLLPITNTTPKPMLPINGIPHLEYQIRLLKKHGFRDIIFSTSYLHEQIVEHFGNGQKFDVNIRYVQDGEHQRGTGGAIANCLPLLDRNSLTKDGVLVLNGDILTDIDLTAMVKARKEQQQVTTIALVPVENPSEFGVVTTREDGRVTGFVEKPRTGNYGNWINAGIYILCYGCLRALEVMTSINNGKSMIETNYFPWLVEGKEPAPFYAYKHNGYWLDIGTHERYAQAQIDVASQKFSLD